MGACWSILAEAEKPKDERIKTGKYILRQTGDGETRELHGGVNICYWRKYKF